MPTTAAYPTNPNPATLASATFGVGVGEFVTEDAAKVEVEDMITGAVDEVEGAIERAEEEVIAVAVVVAVILSRMLACKDPKLT